MDGRSGSAVAVPRDWWLLAGLAISASAATVSSFSGLRGLALAAGWGSAMSALLPLTVDAYAVAATRVWLGGTHTSPHVRRFARWNAVGAISLSLAGNAVDHALSAGLLRMSWLVVVIVGAVPPAVLGVLTHLASLRQRDGLRSQESGPSPAQAGESGTRSRTTEELLTAAQQADAAHWQTHGKPITRDTLRRELRISGKRASELRRQLQAEREQEPPP